MSVCICICLFLANICPAVCLSSQRERANNNNTKKREEREEREGRRKREEREKALPDCVHMCNRSSSRSGHLFLVMATPREGTHAEQLDQQHTHRQGGSQPTAHRRQGKQEREKGTTSTSSGQSSSWNHCGCYCFVFLVCLVFLRIPSGSAHGKTSCLLLHGSIVLDT